MWLTRARFCCCPPPSIADGPGEDCTVQVLEDGSLNAASFDVPESNMPDFQVISGTQFCSLDADGCVTDGPGNYATNANCQIRVMTDGWLQATEFDVEKRYAWENGADFVTINGTAYCQGDTNYCLGGTSINNIRALAGETIAFHARGDYTRIAQGFTICMRKSCPDRIEIESDRGTEQFCGSSRVLQTTAGPEEAVVPNAAGVAAGPQKVKVAAGSSFTWHTDAGGPNHGRGWSVCLGSTLSPSTSPTTSPTISPTASPSYRPTYAGMLEVTYGQRYCRVTPDGLCVNHTS